jgi:hypothetical protein
LKPETEKARQRNERNVEGGRVVRDTAFARERGGKKFSGFGGSEALLVRPSGTGRRR